MSRSTKSLPIIQAASKKAKKIEEGYWGMLSNQRTQWD